MQTSDFASFAFLSTFYPDWRVYCSILMSLNLGRSTRSFVYPSLGRRYSNTSSDACAGLGGSFSCCCQLLFYIQAVRCGICDVLVVTTLYKLLHPAISEYLVITFGTKCAQWVYRLREKQPVYLHSMLAASIPSHSLRSNNDNSLSVPRVKTNTGARAFHSCAPSLWNNLPLSVRSTSSVATFKKYLKTHLFDLVFPP